MISSKLKKITTGYKMKTPRWNDEAFAILKRKKLVFHEFL
jgi:hypothetical protein